MRILLATLLVAACAAAPPTEDEALLARTRAFRAALKDGRAEAARAYVASDARQWFESREGPGRPWRPGEVEGPWHRWDEAMHSTSAYGEWRVEGRAVSVIATETNDFYRLIERPPSPLRLTWYWNEEGLVEGFLVSAVEGERAPDRFDEAQAWAAEHRPDELGYLMPEGELDPSGDRAERWRALLVEWRAAVGLAPVDLAGPGGGDG